MGSETDAWLLQPAFGKDKCCFVRLSPRVPWPLAWGGGVGCRWRRWQALILLPTVCFPGRPCLPVFSVPTSSLSPGVFWHQMLLSLDLSAADCFCFCICLSPGNFLPTISLFFFFWFFFVDRRDGKVVIYCLVLNIWWQIWDILYLSFIQNTLFLLD